MTAVLSDARRGHRGLYGFAIAMTALTAVLLLAAVLDQRTLLGAPLWFKPLKFSISLAAYSFTLAWMLGQLREPALRRAGWAITTAGAIEILIIVGQAARGVRSHFNDDTLGDSLLFALMGVTIVVLWLATAAIALRFLREPGRDRAAGTAIRLGLVVGLLGMGVGFVMSAIGSHAVGVPDGGPGLLLVGWSTTGGDLRIGHFVGMHALQALPLLAAALAATGRYSEAARTRIVTVAAVAYGAVVLLLTWQALRGQPLLAPDALTLGALAVVVLGAAGALVAGRARVPA
ncbi:hypothetical protein GCM10017691_43510 [Pseudonocardia petroleophila]|uniref:Uncharacterized protein n=1 Tax=Pseudonocardia petroleophila TaxID=37331 RepID=A0A7G7MB17_9PSEU|nr:hypothetical protein [Pseudonocardia petroleophila]QNG49978.1 hypothetical protein H6H00_17000 [Pseudonocardia petroleophila]